MIKKDYLRQIFGRHAYVSQQVKESLALLRKGDPESQSAAAERLKVYADRGDSGAMLARGLMALYGIGIDKNVREARAMFERGAKKECARCLFELFIVMHYVDGRVPALKDEIAPLVAAADGDDEEAQYVLANLEMHGWGVGYDFEQAMLNLSRSAGQDHGKAKFELEQIGGTCRYLDMVREEFGDVIPLDERKFLSKALFRAAACLEADPERGRCNEDSMNFYELAAKVGDGNSKTMLRSASVCSEASNLLKRLGDEMGECALAGGDEASLEAEELLGDWNRLHRKIESADVQLASVAIRCYADDDFAREMAGYRIILDEIAEECGKIKEKYKNLL